MSPVLSNADSMSTWQIWQVAVLIVRKFGFPSLFWVSTVCGTFSQSRLCPEGVISRFFWITALRYCILAAVLKPTVALPRGRLVQVFLDFHHLWIRDHQAHDGVVIACHRHHVEKYSFIDTNAASTHAKNKKKADRHEPWKNQ